MVAVDQTDARFAEVNGIVYVRPPAYLTQPGQEVAVEPGTSHYSVPGSNQGASDPAGGLCGLRRPNQLEPNIEPTRSFCVRFAALSGKALRYELTQFFLKWRADNFAISGSERRDGQDQHRPRQGR